jgi:DNA-binding XRE family transcriptional regulator
MKLQEFLSVTDQKPSDFAKKIGVQPQMLYMWLTEKSVPNFMTKEKIYEATKGKVAPHDFCRKRAGTSSRRIQDSLCDAYKKFIEHNPSYQLEYATNTHAKIAEDLADEEAYMPLPRLARFLNLPYEYLYNNARQGKMTITKINGYLHIQVKDVLKFLASQMSIQGMIG